MTRVLFETGYMSWAGLKWIIGVVCIVLFLYFICFKGLIKADNRIRIKGRRIGILRSLECGILFIIMIFVFAVIEEYIDIVVRYKFGNYIEIEGTVEDYFFEPGREGTTFTVDGVEFHCPNSAWGYQPIDENIPVIKENGKHLRIRYISNEVNGNVIVYIEGFAYE